MRICKWTFKTCIKSNAKWFFKILMFSSKIRIKTSPSKTELLWIQNFSDLGFPNSKLSIQQKWWIQKQKKIYLHVQTNALKMEMYLNLKKNSINPTFRLVACLSLVNMPMKHPIRIIDFGFFHFSKRSPVFIYGEVKCCDSREGCVMAESGK